VAIADELRELMHAKKLSQHQVVEVVKRFHPKFDKTVVTKCCRDNDYGVNIKRAALNALYREYAPELLPKAKKQRDGRHRLTARITGRLEDEEMAALLEIIGEKTIQEWLTDIVRQQIKERKANEIS